MTPGEHVLTAAEVRAAGGHGAIFRLREALRRGLGPDLFRLPELMRQARIPPIRPMLGFAGGGPVMASATASGTGARGTSVDITGRFSLDPRLIGEFFATRDGQRVLFRAARDNRKAWQGLMDRTPGA